MATRLLSFLNDIEQALLQEPAAPPAAWNCQRMVNFKSGLARMTLTPAAGGEMAAGGSILVQSILLANESMCLKAVLCWESSPATTTVAIHPKPRLDWAAEARQIAATWLAGPPATATVEVVTPALSAAATPPAESAASG